MKLYWKMSSVIQILPDSGTIILRSIFFDDSKIHISLIQNIFVVFLELLIGKKCLHGNLDIVLSLLNIAEARMVEKINHCFLLMICKMNPTIH